MSTFVSIFTVLIFALIYYLNFEFLYKFNQKKLTSFVAGFGIVYVIIYMLPQLAHGHHLLDLQFPQSFILGNNSFIYLVTLFGSIFFYLFDLILSLTEEYRDQNIEKQNMTYNYWMHIVFFALYNLLIGFVVGSDILDTSFQQFIYLIAYIIHFVAIRWGVYNLNPIKYNFLIRYIFIGSLFFGYLSAFIFNIPEYVLYVFESFMTGGMLLLVFNHEIPIKKDSDRLSLVMGVIVATVLFMIL